MAMWKTTLRPEHQEFIKYIFSFRQIECEAHIEFIPYWNEYWGYFKTAFKYLHLNEKMKMEIDFLARSDQFVNAIENARNIFECEYNNYFNEL